jgi:hypothetical protein
MDRILGIHFRPPLAIARVGGSDTPLECFSWAYDRTTYGAHRTVIRPTLTFEVLGDGSLRPYIPKTIQFRDGDRLRPVAPFFELWASVQSGATGETEERPVTLKLLEQLGASADSIDYAITLGNRKAQRRTGSAACAYLARATASASDWQPKTLLAFSPHNADEEPLVSPDRPIPLGRFQAIRPVAKSSFPGVDLSALRVRFTPARGQVYGPPQAVAAPASPLQPGEALPAVTLGGKLHEIVPPANRIVNPNTPWSRYAMDQAGQRDPAPSDSYDGANVGDDRSWGVVDDSCDGVIEAQLVVDGRRFLATARVLSSCPDFAPDRRPFYSLADDLDDRDLTEPPPASRHDLKKEIADLFKRIFETASVINLDATRHKFIAENLSLSPPEKFRGLPAIDAASMTRDDDGYVDLTPALLPGSTAEGDAQDWLRYTDIARLAHGKLADFETLMAFLVLRRDHVLRLVRPPFGRFRQLDSKAPVKPNARFRDSRLDRDLFHDMRMPPYMRDSDANPLSLTWRQYQTLLQLIEELAGSEPAPMAAKRGDGLRDQPSAGRRERK